MKNIKRIVLICLLPLSLFGWKMESGTVTLPATTAGSSTWQIVALQQTYDTPPLIFAMPNEGSGYPGDSPAALRVKNITTTGFEIVQVEPQGSDGPHPEMNPIHYVAIEAGDHILPDGTKIEAGSIDTQAFQGKNASGSTSWAPVSFATSFSAKPVVFGMIQTTANEDHTVPGANSQPWMVTAIEEIDTSGFETAIDMVKTSAGSITSNETIAYLAIEDDISSSFIDNLCTNILFDTIVTSTDVRGWDNECFSQSYNSTFTSEPNILGAMQTRSGGDGGWLRRCSLSSGSVGITVDEDGTKRKHGRSENAGLLAFSEDFAFDSTFNSLGCNLIAEYRMDECYWLGAGTFDVADTVGGNNCESYNGAQIDTADAVVNHSGDFIYDGYFQPENTIALASEWTYTFWMKFPLDSTGHEDFSSSSLGFQYYFSSASLSTMGDLPAFTLNGTDLQWAVYDESGGFVMQDLSDSLNTSGWHHIAFVKKSDDTTLLYVDGAYTDTIALGTDGSLGYFLTSSDNTSGQTLSTSVDEAKLWNRALGASEITDIRNNENAGNNYDGSTREPITCDASITGGTWELVGIPADFRNSRNPKKTVDEIFGDDMSGSYGIDWRIYRRDYSDTDNSSSYTYLNSTDQLEFGIGYWLGSGLSSTWSENGAMDVDYDSASTGCSANRCVEIDLKSATHDFNVDPDDGTGPYRYNMSGFVGHSPVQWADCRFIVDGTVMTPSELESNSLGSRQIWQYNPGSGSANSNGYTTCDDTMGSCMLEPYKGFWIELHGPSKGKSIKLLIPKE